MPWNKRTLKYIEKLARVADEDVSEDELMKLVEEADRARVKGSRGAESRRFTVEKGERVIEGLRRGLTLSAACARAKVSVSVVKGWIREAIEWDGEKRIEEGQLEFLEEFRASPASLEYALLGYIIGAAVSGSWSAAAWLLERLWPDRYARVIRNQVTGRSGEPLRVVLDVGLVDGVMEGGGSGMGVEGVEERLVDVVRGGGFRMLELGEGGGVDGEGD